VQASGEGIDHDGGGFGRVAAVPATSTRVVDADHAFVACRRKITRVIVMLDFLMVAGGVAFFVVAILYVLACEKM
jgi:hypothetical protein